MTVQGLGHAGALLLAEHLEESLAADPLAVSVNETDEQKGLWNVVAYFKTETDAGSARDALELKAASIDPLPESDWVANSLRGLAPVVAGRFYLYGSHDRAQRRTGGISLEIDAGTAFGTGHHGTTAGCLLALDRELKRRRPRRVLDLGCGTGVLAIAAAAAIKRPVLATDIDPEAVRVTRLNAAKAGVGPLLRGFAAPGLAGRRFAGAAPFDLIFANILARPLVQLAGGLSLLLAPQGTLILSGITRDQVRWIEATYRSHGLIAARRSFLGEWATLTMRSRGKEKRPELFRSGR
ncbi:MAG: 50S ribosomal protein L11 methyltransferase [Rhizobiales bacterium]|nr:50S ribosomal protein L11 methyltransferase [Hyphomicrobiales bacterium]